MADAFSVVSIRERATAQALPNRIRLGFVAVAVLLAISWSHTFYEMWLRWFPAWSLSSTSSWNRIVEGDSYYTHGPLVPLVSLIMAWCIYKRAGFEIRRTPSATVIGWTTFLFSLAAHLASMYARVTFVSGYALIGVMLGLFMLWGGWRLLRQYWIPVTCLIFMVPLPMVWIAGLNFTLKTEAIGAAIWLTNTVFHIPVLMDGSIVYLPAQHEGASQFLIIESVCGGLRSLISLTWFAALFICLSRLQGFWRWFLFVISIPIAILCNIFRITFFCVIGNFFGVEMISADSVLHQLSGVLLFVGAIGVLFGIERVIMEIGRRLDFNWVGQSMFHDSLSPRLSPTDSAHHKIRTINTFAPAPLFVLMITALFSVGWSFQQTTLDSGHVARLTIPQTIQIKGQQFTGIDHDLDAGTLAILETSDYVCRRFSSGNSQAAVDVLLIFSANNRKGIHPPEVCLEGGGNQIVHKKEVHLSGTSNSNLNSIPAVRMRELVTQRGIQKTFHLYTYKAGDVYTPDFLQQQASIFLNGFLSRNTSGSLLRISVQVDRENIKYARETVMNFARELIPHIEQHWPGF